MKLKWLLVALLVSSASTRSNEIRIGVSFDVSEGARVRVTSSIKPWLRLHIDKSYPDNVNKFRANEMHHGYLGLALIGSGVILKNKLMRVAGEVLLIDDVIQHTLRVKTPVHMLSDELWKYSWYRNVSGMVQ